MPLLSLSSVEDLFALAAERPLLLPWAGRRKPTTRPASMEGSRLLLVAEDEDDGELLTSPPPAACSFVSC